MSDGCVGIFHISILSYLILVFLLGSLLLFFVRQNCCSLPISNRALPCQIPSRSGIPSRLSTCLPAPNLSSSPPHPRPIACLCARLPVFSSTVFLNWIILFVNTFSKTHFFGLRLGPMSNPSNRSLIEVQLVHSWGALSGRTPRPGSPSSVFTLLYFTLLRRGVEISFYTWPMV